MAALTACANFLKLELGNVLTDRCKPMESEPRRRASGGGWKSSFTLLEIFLTLVRLRRGIDLRLIGDLYGVSESTVSRIFKTMVNYMYLRLGMLPIWPNPEHVSAHLPRIFRELYPSTFIVIDATELRCEVASSLPAQSQLYSAYKSHTTVKGFLGMTPDGAVSFVSEIFGGSISDHELVIKSHFLDLLPADMVRRWWQTKASTSRIFLCHLE